LEVGREKILEGCCVRGMFSSLTWMVMSACGVNWNEIGKAKKKMGCSGEDVVVEVLVWIYRGQHE